VSASIPFDTLDYAKKLEHAGTPAAQAELQSKALADVLRHSVAFPGDLLTVERKLSGHIDAAALRIENRLVTLAGEVNLIRWMLASLLAINLAIGLKIFL